MSEPSPESLQSLLKKASLKLKQAGIESARLEAELIFAHLLGMSRAELYLSREKPLSPALIQKTEEMIEKRAQRVPLAYLLKKAWFRQLELEIDDSVMVPRPETELLVEEAIRLILSSPEIKKILDLGTGSGAIVLSLAYELKDCSRRWEFFASDISASALQLAKRNAQKYQLEKKIKFFLGNLFQPFSREKFDLIVCNPPYIAKDELKKLAPELSYEPKLALDGGKDGLRVIEQILSQAHHYLTDKGWLLLEVGLGQAETLRARNFSGLELKKIKKDYLGIERIVIYQRGF